MSWTKNTELAHKSELWSYEKLIDLVQTPSQRLPIVVVDFGNSFRKTRTDSTDMTKLAALLDVVAEQDPLAIGVDVRFGATDLRRGIYPDGQDQVVNKATDLRAEGIKVFLTVNEGLGNPDSTTWLGTPDLRFRANPNKEVNPKTSEFVAHALVPKVETGGHFTLFNAIQIPGSGVTVPSLAGALADEYRKKHHLSETQRGSWLLEAYAEPVEEQGTLGSRTTLFPASVYYLNYSALGRLKDETIDVGDDGQLLLTPRKDLPPAKSIFIIGSADPSRDPAPGPHGDPGGLYLHALGAYTLLFAPLYALTFWPRLIVDAFLMAGLLLVNSKLESRLETKRPMGAPTLGLLAGSLTAMVVCTLFGVALARLWGIIWTDWIVILIILWIDFVVHVAFEAIKKDQPKSEQIAQH